MAIGVRHSGFSCSHLLCVLKHLAIANLQTPAAENY